MFAAAMVVACVDAWGVFVRILPSAFETRGDCFLNPGKEEHGMCDVSCCHLLASWPARKQNVQVRPKREQYCSSSPIASCCTVRDEHGGHSHNDHLSQLLDQVKFHPLVMMKI